MDIEEIIPFALNKAKQSNEIIMKNGKWDDKKSVTDKYNYGLHDLYKDSCKMLCDIRNHAVKGVFPKELFEHRSPNQTDKEANYIEKNYKQVTLPYFIDFLNTITRPFGDGNWSIDYKEDDKEYKDNDLTFQKYVESETPTYKSLEFFIKSIAPSIKTMDANGFVAVRPLYIDYIEDETGEFVINSQTLVKPTMIYFDSTSVIDYSEDEFYLFLSKEKSIVKDSGGKNIESGSIFELYTKTGIYFFSQTGEKTKNLFNIELFFETKRLAVHQLKGIPSIKDDKLLWQSPFIYATDILDRITCNSNFLQASNASCMFPVKVMYGSPCEFKDSEGSICQDGKIINDKGIERTCTSCGGIGLKSRISPLGTLLLNPTTKFEVGEDKSVQDPLRYVSPDPTSLEFIRKCIADDEVRAKAILHLRNKNSTTKTVDGVTATEIADDAKGMTAFVKPISDQIFELYEFCLNIIGEQRYGDKFHKPTLTYPKSFDFKTPEDYLNEIQNAIKNNLDPSLVIMLILQYVSSYYSDSISTTQIFTLIANADRLFGISQADINLQLARGTVAKWQSILHTSILSFISELERKDEKFLTKDLQEQIDQLQQRAKEEEKSITESSNLYTTLLPTGPTN